jgi:copper transport protein
MLLLVPATADAHAALVSSDPAPGTDAGATPAVVTLLFDEPLVESLSKATVTGPGGRQFTSTVSDKTMHVPLSGNVPGVYRVDWKTVSRIDGHTITGTFRFGVGVAVTSSLSTPGPGSGDIVLAGLRAIEYALLMLACGMALLGRLGRELPLRQPAVPVAAALLVSGVIVVGGEAVLASSGLSVRGTLDYLSIGTTGWARVTRLLIEAALLAFALLRRHLSGTLLAGVIGSVAVAGHGADVEPAWQGMAVNAGHLAAAGLWAGGIMALALIRLRAQWSVVWKDIVPRFSRVAPWAFGVSVGLGAVQATQLLGSPQQVLDTSYGLTLVAKAVVIAAMVPLSLLAWRRAREHVRGEAVLALVVTAAAAALAAFPVIPKESSEAAAEHQAPLTKRVPWFPQPGDLTMGGRAGKVMVGLSLNPGRPGPNTATVYLATPPASRSTTALIRVGGRSFSLRSCGTSCRTGTVDLQGRETLDVEVSGHGTAVYRLPVLPAKDGQAIVTAAAQWMNRLHTYRVREVLSGFHSAYVYATPHKMYLRTWYGDGPQDTLWLGPKVYKRLSPTARWRLESTGVVPPVPYFVWMPFTPLVDVHVVGTATVAGTPVTVLVAFGGHGNDPEAVWFTIYVDPATHQVLRSQMWAPNHFMDDRYQGFDQPVNLPKPGHG